MGNVQQQRGFQPSFGFRPSIRPRFQGAQPNIIRNPQRFNGPAQNFRPRPPLKQLFYSDGTPYNGTDAGETAFISADNIQTEEDSNVVCVVSSTLNPLDIYWMSVMKLIVIDTGCKKNILSTKMLDRIQPFCISEKMTKTNFQFSFGGNKPKTAMGEIDIVFVYPGYKLPMKVLVVTDKVPFLIGMETIRELTHGDNGLKCEMEYNWIW